MRARINEQKNSGADVHRQGKKNQRQPPLPCVRPRAKFPFCGGVSLHLHKKKCIWQETLREL